MHRFGAFALFFSTGIASALGTPAGFDADAVRLNNRGVAQMGQQFTDRAAATFADAFKKDPKLAQAAVNEGIALMTLQKLDEAKTFCKRPSHSIPTIPRPGTTSGSRNTRITNSTPRLPAFSRPSSSIRAMRTPTTSSASAMPR